MESLPISQTKSFWKLICACKIHFAWVAMFSTVAKLKNNYCNCFKFHSPRCLGQETAKGPFSLRVKLPPVHLSTTHSRGFTLSPKLLNAKHGSCELPISLVFGLTRPEIKPEHIAFVARRFIHSTTSLSFSNSIWTRSEITLTVLCLLSSVI